MKTIAKWALWQRRWSIFWWTLGILAFVFLTLIFYPTIKGQTAQLDKSFAQIPRPAKRLFTDTSDIFSPVGYLSSQIFYLLLPLLLSIFAISMGISLLGKEERDSTIEMLLARPISRARLLFGKAKAGLEAMVIVAVVTAVFTSVMSHLVKVNVSFLYIFETALVAALLALCFGAITFMLAAMGRAGRALSIAVAAGIGLGGYIIVSLEPSVSWLRWPAKIFPFSYYHSADLLTGKYNFANLIYFGCLIAGCL
ncbi:MAG TPA: ABC transporter permease subunit, partial [Candidatus Saccharimonadales bacterium]|nr:ABC transporter permease subunit [Candidatus Saccharimonadales bacterium]